MIKEYRITLPMSTAEYKIAQLYCVSQTSKEHTRDGEGVEIMKNEPFENTTLGTGEVLSGQYTHKIYHVASHVPAIVRFLIPSKVLDIHEEAWNAYPYCKTVLTNAGFSSEKFKIEIETIHLDDCGDSENVHNLNEEERKVCEIVKIDIANQEFDSYEYKEDEDPTRFKSAKTGRGPLTGNWQETVSPVMTCYKLVRAQFQWFGLQNRVENYIHETERCLFFKFHRQVFCTMDQWYELQIDDIRNMEEETRIELYQKLQEYAVATT